MSRFFQLLSDLSAAAAKQPLVWLAVLIGALVLALASALLLRRQRRHGQQAGTVWSVQAGGLAPTARSFSLPPAASAALTGDDAAATDDGGSADAVGLAPVTEKVAGPSSAQSLAWWDDDTSGEAWSPETGSQAAPDVPSVYAALAVTDDDPATAQPDARPERDAASTTADATTADHSNRT